MRLTNILVAACALFCLAAIASTASAQTLAASTTWNSGTGNNGHVYQLYTGPAAAGGQISFAAANTFANGIVTPPPQNGPIVYNSPNLASITNANEQAFLVAFNNANGGGDWWAGGTDHSTLGTTPNEWIWTDGSGNFWDQGGGGNPQNGLYANWNGGEPNGGGDGEAALQIQGGGGWNDLPIANTLGRFIVEWDALETPEPASIALWSLLGIGLAGFGVYRLRRKVGRQG